MTVSGDGLLAFEWFQGDGASTTFDIKFYFLTNADLKFLVEREDGTLDPVTPSQIMGAGKPNGGSFTLSEAPLSTERAGVFRDLSLGQPTDVEAQEDIPPASIQIALDRLAMVDIQQQDGINRAIRLSDSDSPGDFRIPVQAERAGRYFAFDAAGDPIVRTITDIGAAEVATQQEADTGVGDGLVVAEHLPAAVAALTPPPPPPVVTNIVQNHVTTANLYASSQDRHITPLDTTIDDVAAGNAVLVQAAISFERDHNGMFYLTRNGIEIGSPDPAGHTTGIAPVAYDGEYQSTMQQSVITYLDVSPEEGSNTYRIWNRGGNDQFALNRTLNDPVAGSYERSTSTVILTEVVQ